MQDAIHVHSYCSIVIDKISKLFDSDVAKTMQDARLLAFSSKNIVVSYISLLETSAESCECHCLFPVPCYWTWIQSTEYSRATVQPRNPRMLQVDQKTK